MSASLTVGSFCFFKDSTHHQHQQHRRDLLCTLYVIAQSWFHSSTLSAFLRFVLWVVKKRVWEREGDSQLVNSFVFIIFSSSVHFFCDSVSLIYVVLTLVSIAFFLFIEYENGPFNFTTLSKKENSFLFFLKLNLF